MTSDVMKKISIEKVTLNIGAGAESEKVEKAKVLLNNLSAAKVISTFATDRIPTWKLRPGLPIGVKTTIRTHTLELLKRFLVAVNNELPEKSFTESGFSFGIKEYIDIPDAKYDPKIGIMGLDVCVTLKRPGYRVKLRKLRKSKIAAAHRITPAQAKAWAVENLGVKWRGAE